jgi:hypothetical protein
MFVLLTLLGPLSGSVFFFFAAPLENLEEKEFMIPYISQ